LRWLLGGTEQLSFVVSHISRKTSEMWGTRRLLRGSQTAGPSTSLRYGRDDKCESGRCWWGLLLDEGKADPHVEVEAAELLIRPLGAAYGSHGFQED